MVTLLKLCGGAYGWSLRFYPAALRHAFGDEMREVFEWQIRDAWENCGWSALLRVLLCATRELFSEALPAAAGSPPVIAAASSCVCTGVVFWGLLWALQNPSAVKEIGDRLQRGLLGG